MWHNDLKIPKIVFIIYLQIWKYIFNDKKITLSFSIIKPNWKLLFYNFSENWI